MNFSLEYCLSLEEKIETLEKRCDMQQEIIDDVNFLLRYHEQFVKSCEDIGEKEQAIIDV